MKVTRSFEIKNKLGLHARPAAKLADLSNRYKSEIFFERNGHAEDAKSILSILTLACPMGSALTIRAEGADADEAVEALGNLIKSKFGEE